MLMLSFSGMIGSYFYSLIVDLQSNGDIKLVGSETDGIGRVELYLDNKWGTIDTGGKVNLIGPGQAICRQLQYYDVKYAAPVGFFRLV